MYLWLHGDFSLKNCMWVDRVLAFAGVLRETSWGLSCPFHCGGSWVLPFVAGLACGILSGLALAALLAFHFHSLWISSPAVPSPVGSDPLLLRRRARFSAYLHEWGCNRWTYPCHQSSCSRYWASDLLLNFWSCCIAWHQCFWFCDRWYQDFVSSNCPLPAGHLDSSLQSSKGWGSWRGASRGSEFLCWSGSG